MSVLQSIQAALSEAGVTLIGMGKYPETGEPCGKIIFTDKNKPAGFLGGASGGETFKVVVRGNDYLALEQKANSIKTALKNAGFIQIGGFEDVEPKAGETFMQLAVNFKFIQ